MAESQAGEGVEATGEVAPAADTPAADARAADVPAEPDLVGDALAYLARSLVSNVDDVRVERLQTERGLVYRLHVNSEDMGRVIGRSGRIARALRQVTRAAAARAGVHAIIEIAD
jgi:predicted RNA-binding protein YlqC (UPF0109 family)